MLFALIDGLIAIVAAMLITRCADADYAIFAPRYAAIER